MGTADHDTCVHQRPGRGVALCALGALAACGLAQSGGSWTHLGGESSRESRGVGLAPDLSSPAWTLTHDQLGRSITFTPSAGVLVSFGVVVATGTVDIEGVPAHFVYGVRAFTGELEWQAPIDAPLLDSFSTPAIDEEHQTAIVASGSSLRAIRLHDGATAWTTMLPRAVVDASPVCTFSGGASLGVGDRVFVVDYEPFGVNGSLHCVNVDAFDASENPHAPGEIVWSVALGGTSGNSPSVAHVPGVGTRVIVATSGDFGVGAGRVVCFDAASESAPSPVWTFENVVPLGFFGGVGVMRDSSGTWSVLAASYSFTGGRTSANLVKLDALTGALSWSVGCNRTAGVPVHVEGGRVVLAGGLDGFGSIPTLQLFDDLGTSAAMVWDSAAATWTDLDGDTRIDEGEYLRVGGWTMSPSLLYGRRLLVGTLDHETSSVGASEAMMECDLLRVPSDPEFVRQVVAATGNAPAIVGVEGGAWVFSTGPGGLRAFAPIGVPADLNGDGWVTTDDLRAWDANSHRQDLDGDGVIDGDDRAVLVGALRDRERELLVRGRP